MPIHGLVLIILMAVPSFAAAQNERGPYARIAVLRPHDGKTVDFESGYIRHLAFHDQAKDPWAWYGWTVTFGDRQRWFVYATFGHAAANFDNAVAPVDDERDNILNVAPHAEFVGNALYEYLPALSLGSAQPSSMPRLEMTTVELTQGSEPAFEAAITAAQSTLQGETLWYRMIAGGAVPRYVRLRPGAGFASVVDGKSAQALPSNINNLIERVTVEILTLRSAMSHNLKR